MTNPHRFSTGVPTLDDLLEEVRPGDNLVFYTPDPEPYRLFAAALREWCHREGRRLVYIRVDGSLDKVMSGLPEEDVFDVVPRCRDPQGLMADLKACVQEKGRGVYYVCDNLTAMRPLLGGEQELRAFFAESCHLLFQLGTVAYWLLLKGEHAAETVAAMRDCTQVFLDFSVRGRKTVLQPTKVLGRYPESMFVAHRVTLRRSRPHISRVREWGIAARLGLLSVGFLLVVLASVVANLWGISTQRDDALVVNLAGRQRMLSQETVKLAFLGALKDQDPRHLEDMHLTAHEFEDGLRVLLDGGQVSYAGGAGYDLPPTTDPAIRAALEEVRAVFESMHGAVHAILEHPPGSPAFTQGLTDLERLSVVILEEMDRAVRLYQAAAEVKMARLRSIQIAFFLGAVAFLVIGHLLTRRSVVRPVQTLEAHARRMGRGDLETPVPSTGEGEIGLLAAASEAMREGLRAAQAEQARLFGETRRRALELEARQRVTQAVLRAIDLEERLRIALREIIALVGGPESQGAGEGSGDSPLHSSTLAPLHSVRGAIYLVEEERLVLRVQQGFSEGFLARARDLPLEACPWAQTQTVVNAPWEGSDPLTQALQREAVMAWTSQPLRVEERLVGVLLLADRRTAALEPDTLRALNALAEQVAVALHNARLYTQSRERLARLTTLREIDRAIAAQLSLEDVISVVLDRVHPHIPVDAVGLSLMDWEKKRTVLGHLRLPGGEDIRGEAFTLSDSLLEWLAVRREPVMIYDLLGDPRVRGHRDIIRQHGLKSYLGVPLVVQDQTIGVLHVFTVKPHAFSAEEADFFATMAGQTAISIQNARMYEAALRRGEALAALARSTLSLAQAAPQPEAIRTLLESACRATGTDRGAWLTYDEANKALRPEALVGFPPEVIHQVEQGLRMGLSASLAPAVAAVEGHPIYLGQTRSSPLWPDLDPSLNCAYCVPLTYSGRLHGVFVLLSEQEDAITLEQRSIADTFAAYAAGALDNARLSAETRQRANELAGLYRLALDLAGVVEPGEVCRQVTAAAARSLGAARCLVAEFNHEARQVRGLAPAYGLPDEIAVAIRYTVDDQVVALWDISRIPHFIVGDTAALPSPLRELAARAGVHSLLAARLIAQDQPTGILFAADKESGLFDEDDARLLAAYAQQAVLALERARLYQEAAQRLRELEFLNRAALAATAALDLDVVLDQVTALMADELKYPHVGIALVDAAGEKVELRAQRGMLAAQGGPARPVIRVGQGLVGWVVEHGEPLLVNDVSQDPRYVVGIAETRSELVAPLRVGERTIGVINVESPQSNAFGASDLQLLTTLAGQIAAEVERARLFDETRRRLLELSALFEVSTALRAARNADEMLPIILEKTAEVTGADAGALLLQSGDTGELEVAAGLGPLATTQGLRLKRGEGIAGHVVEMREPYITHSLAADPRLAMPAAFAGLHGSVCIPLRTGEETVGALLLGCQVRRRPGPDKVRLVSTIAEMAGNAIHRARLFERTTQQAQELAALVDKLEENYDQTLAALSAALDARDRETEGHSLRVAGLACTIAREMGLPNDQVQVIYRGALLHDVGKIGISDTILHKPASLSDQEWEIMRQHPEIGCRILHGIRFLENGLDIVAYHHEKYDGTGYPGGLKGEEIPLSARIFAVADVYDSVTSDRPYRAAMSHEDALAEVVRRSSGTHFDPQVVETFVSLFRQGLDITGGGGHRHTRFSLVTEDTPLSNAPRSSAATA